MSVKAAGRYFVIGGVERFRQRGLPNLGDRFRLNGRCEPSASCFSEHLNDVTVVARDFARIFLQNGINLGLRMVICPTLEANEGDLLEVGDKAVTNRASGMSYPIVPLPQARQAIIDAGGLIPYTRRLLTA